MRFTPFDDEGPPLGYGDNVLNAGPPEAIELDLDEVEGAAVVDWFYDPKPLIDTPAVNDPSYRYWSLSLPFHGMAVPASPPVPPFRSGASSSFPAFGTLRSSRTFFLVLNSSFTSNVSLLTCPLHLSKRSIFDSPPVKTIPIISHNIYVAP
jgi:hypothetical protein